VALSDPMRIGARLDPFDYRGVSCFHSSGRDVSELEPEEMLGLIKHAALITLSRQACVLVSLEGKVAKHNLVVRTLINI